MGRRHGKDTKSLIGFVLIIGMPIVGKSKFGAQLVGYQLILAHLSKSYQFLATFGFAKCWLAKYWQCQTLAANLHYRASLFYGQTLRACMHFLFFMIKGVHACMNIFKIHRQTFRAGFGSGSTLQRKFNTVHN